eukprot:Phypoly_transcript_00319.p1 GENE.Phypoly_transcript_00319~~Phypoly_transcript_00319.p1  ORF type:complete len:1731 (-),score=444.64 Phypoly_transcript_00319:70-5262(-)
MPPSKPPPLQFYNHQQYLKRYKEAKTYGEFYQLQKEVQNEENRYRELFAKSRSSKTLQDPFLMMIPVYKNLDAFQIRALSPEEAKMPKIFDPTNRPPAGAMSTVATQEDFQRNFNLFTESLLKGLNWDNMFVAGGSVMAALLPIPEQYDKNNRTRRQYYHNVAYKSSDVDVFIYGLDAEQANKKMEEIYKHISDSLHVEAIAFRSQHAVTIVSQYPFRHVQIVLRLYKSPAEVLMGFDVDSCAMGYDGKNVFVMPRCQQALVSRFNTIDMTRRSPSYEMRLAKYSQRGFGVLVPFLERKKVDPQIFEKGFDQVQGLARLLLLERLSTPEARSQFKNQQRLRKLMPQYERRGSYWETLTARFQSDDYVREREGEGSAVASDYSTVFLPWSPKWTATKVRHLMYTKDLILNSEWYDEEKKVHTHPCFFGTVQEVLTDCCGTCPPEPPVQPGPDPTTGMDNPFVRGPLTWVTVNPGAQTIGSFHPITEGDWTEGAYIDPKVEKLCLAVNADDVREATRLIFEGANVDSRDALGRTPLVIAALSNSVECAKVLIKNKAWVSSKIAGGRTALHIAAQYGHNEIVKLILERGVELKALKAQTDAAAALLKKMNLQKDKDALKDFVVLGKKKKKSDDDEDEDEDGGDEDEDMADADDDGGGDEDGGDDDDEDGGHKKKKQPGVEEPKEDILEVDGKDNDMHMTPLHYATFFGWNDAIETLLQFGASIEKMREQDNQTISVLYLATFCDQLDTFKLLLAKGAPINQVDKQLNTILHLVTKAGKENFVKAILASKASKEPIKVSSLNAEQDSALHIAVTKRNEKIAQLLVNQGAIVHYKEADYKANMLQHGDFLYFQQPIFKTLYDENILRFLLDNGADINAQHNKKTFFETVRDSMHQSKFKLNVVYDKQEFTPADVDKAIAAAGKNTYQAYRLRQKYEKVYSPDVDQKAKKEEKLKALKEEKEEAEKANKEIKNEIAFVRFVATRAKVNAFKNYDPAFETPKPPEAQTVHIEKKICLLLDPCSYLYNHHHTNAEVDEKKAWQLFEAAFAGDIATINKLTEKNALYVCMQESETGNTPLHVAAINNHYDAIVRLIEIAQAQYVPVPEVEQEESDVTPINNYALASNMHYTFIAPKKKFKFDPNKIDLNIYTHSPSEFVLNTNNQHYNLIHIMAVKGYAESIHAILEILDDMDNIPLANVIDKPDYVRPSIPSALISHHSSNNYYTPFELAIIFGTLDAAQVLLQHAGWLPQVMSEKQMEQKQKDDAGGYYTGLNVGGKKMTWASDFYGKSKKSKNRVLFLAAYFNQVASLKFILSGTAYDLFIQGQLRKQISDEGKKKKEKQKKISKKQKVTASLSISKPQAKFDPIPLDTDRVNKIKIIFKGWNLDDKDKKENTLFHMAVEGNAPEAIRYLAQVAVEKKMTTLINAGTKKKDISPVYLAAHKGFEKCLVALVENGADLSKVDSSIGWTPLHAAVSTTKCTTEQRIEIVKAVLAELKKAKKSELINARGTIHLQTPLMVALSIKDGLPLAKLLLEAGASVVETDMDGNTSLHVITKISANDGLEDVLKAAETLKKKELVTTENSLGLTPLDYARIAVLKHWLSKATTHKYKYWGHNKKQKAPEDKKEHPSMVFIRTLQKLASEGHLRRVATDPVSVRDMIERSIAHSNAAVEKARKKAEQNKFQYNPYRDDDEEDYEDEDDNFGDFSMSVPDYDKYLEDHAPHEIKLTNTAYEKPKQV